MSEEKQVYNAAFEEAQKEIEEVEKQLSATDACDLPESVLRPLFARHYALKLVVQGLGCLTDRYHVEVTMDGKRLHKLAIYAPGKD